MFARLAQVPTKLSSAHEIQGDSNRPPLRRTVNRRWEQIEVLIVTGATTASIEANNTATKNFPGYSHTESPVCIQRHKTAAVHACRRPFTRTPFEGRGTRQEYVARIRSVVGSDWQPRRSPSASSSSSKTSLRIIETSPSSRRTAHPPHSPSRQE